MTRHRRRATRHCLGAVGLVTAAALALGGCGISASDTPEDVGDAAVIGQSFDSVAPPQPDLASNPVELVTAFLKAASGGGPTASEQVKRFMTEKLQQSWHPDEKNLRDIITVIRVVGEIKPDPRDPDKDIGVPVPVHYQVVGKLDQTGRVTLEEPQRENSTATFWVVPAEEQPGEFRISSIDNPPSAGLYLSDAALTSLYRPQSIYFWDNDVLVPDLRYVPLTISPETQANKIVDWLAGGPSPILANAEPLPINTSRAGVGVVIKGQTLVVKLTPQAAKTLDDRRRLVFQLQWSLRSKAEPPDIELWVGDEQVQPVGANDYLVYNLASQLDREGQKFGITAGKVVKPLETGTATSPVPILASKDNQGVILAAIARRGRLGAFVQRKQSGDLTLIIAFEGEPSKAALTGAREAGRPVWIPGTDRLLISWDKHLYAVGADGGKSPVAISGITSVTSVSISPDGRRVALVADGRVRVGELGVNDKGITVGPTMMPLVLDTRLAPNGVAWVSEQELYVTGVAAGEGALWRVTVDGAVAADRHDILKTVIPADVVAEPKDTFTYEGEVILYSQSGSPYIVGGAIVSPEQNAERPFFIA